MKQVKKIRNRINKKGKNKILSFLSGLMIILSLVLGVLIYMKKDENGQFLKENFNISLNFKTFNSKINDIVDSLFKFELNRVNKQDDLLVNSNVSYIKLDNNLYQTSDNSIIMIENGKVLGIYEEEENTTILVSYNNGVLASYSNVETCLVKQYDELKKGEALGSYLGSFKAIFKKDGNIVSYNEAIE